MKKANPIKARNDVYSKILYLIVLIAIFRFLSHVPVPFIDSDFTHRIANTGVFEIVDIFSNNSFSSLTLMATGISSFVGASIIIQLMSFIFPSLREMYKSAGGLAKIKKYTAVFGCILSFFTSLGTLIIFNNQYNVLTDPSWYAYLIIASLHTLGTFFAIKIGNKISDLGFGDGCSILILVNLLLSLYGIIYPSVSAWIAGADISVFAIFCVGVLVIYVVCIIMNNMVRKVPITYTSVTTRKGAFNSKLDFSYKIRLSVPGVIPIVFAAAVFQILNLVSSYVSDDSWAYPFFSSVTVFGSVEYYILFSSLVFLFSWLYTFLVFNPEDIGFEMQRNLASFPNVRPGSETIKLLAKIRRRNCAIYSILLTALCVGTNMFFDYINIGSASSTSIIIVVSVSLEMFSSIYSSLKLTKIGKLSNDLV